MRWMPRLRMLLARRPWIYWTGVGIVAAALATTIVGSMGSLEHARDAWGSTVPVYVTKRPLLTGERVDDAVTVRDVPRAMVPPSAVGSVAPGAVAQQPVASGEILVDVDVAPRSGPLALLPDGWLAISVDAEQEGANPFVEVGDSATILGSGLVLAPDAIVLGVSATAIVVGVPSDSAAAVADAAARRTAVVAVSASRRR